MEALGIDLKLLLAQIVNFLIVLFLLSKFAYKPILSILESRNEKIATGIKNSEEAAKKLAEAEEEKKKILEKAFKEADEILETAKKDSVEKAASIIKKANDQADNIVSNANNEASLAKEKAMSSAKKELSDVVILALNKIVDKEIDQKTKDNLTAKALSEL